MGHQRSAPRGPTWLLGMARHAARVQLVGARRAAAGSRDADLARRRSGDAVRGVVPEAPSGRDGDRGRCHPGSELGGDGDRRARDPTPGTPHRARRYRGVDGACVVAVPALDSVRTEPTGGSGAVLVAWHAHEHVVADLQPALDGRPPRRRQAARGRMGALWLERGVACGEFDRWTAHGAVVHDTVFLHGCPVRLGCRGDVCAATADPR